MGYIHFFVILFLTTFLIAIAWFLFKSDFSLKSIELLLPAFGAIIFAFFIIFKSVSSAKVEEKIINGYVNLIIEDDKRVVGYPSLEDSLNPSITKHTFYMSYLVSMGIYLQNYVNDKATNKDLVDTVEFAFLEKLLNGWIVKLPSKDFDSYALGSEELLQGISNNNVLNITNADVDIVNNRIGFKQKLGTFKEELEKKKLILPIGMVFSHKSEDQRRIFTFKNKNIEINFYLFDGGVNNFRPEFNSYHQYLATHSTSRLHSDILKMRKFYINFNYKFSRFASFRDDYEEYKKMVEDIETNLKEQLYWEPLKEKLEKEYVLSKI